MLTVMSLRPRRPRREVRQKDLPGEKAAAGVAVLPRALVVATKAWVDFYRMLGCLGMIVLS